MECETALAAIAALPERDLEVLALVNWHGLDARQAARVKMNDTDTAFRALKPAALDELAAEAHHPDGLGRRLPNGRRSLGWFRP
ncbi:hypothetical protein [Actinomadura sp. NTSP31]|uniref:hypothetical protein n=1 Tax=Actinomadura sp. NTSP31 TaxID=1735447 RepID=UPI0035BEE367